MSKQRIFVNLETGETRPYNREVARLDVPRLGEGVSIGKEFGEVGPAIRIDTFTAFTFAVPSILPYEQLADVAQAAWRRGELTP